MSLLFFIIKGIGFFAAGFDTSSNTMTTLCYNLATNPKIQDTIYEEIQSVLDETDGVIDHETINKMEYLEAAIEEDLRMFPPVTRYFLVSAFFLVYSH